MAKFVVNIEGMSNSPPHRIGELYLTVQAPETYTFTSDDFEVNTIPQYADAENDSILKIKILRINIKNQGSITVNGIVVEEGDEILMSDIINGSMIYTPNPNQSEMGNDYFYFDVADTGSQQYGNIIGSIIINVLAVQNLPPSSVGDNDITIDHGDVVLFTREMFTTNTTPPYSDPEGDAALLLRITSLPTNGVIYLAGATESSTSPVVENQIIPFSDIDLGRLYYVPDSGIVDEYMEEFTFGIADAGSGIFVY